MAILAIDQGTTGTTVMIVNKEGKIPFKFYKEFKQIYPRPGWVEHDPEEIWQTVLTGISRIKQQYSGPIHAIGITNQRETTVVWDERSGNPVYNAIVWQCRRTSDLCKKLEPFKETIRHKTGLPPDAYFSGTKIQWILNHVPIPNGAALRFGTIDSWLIWKLTSGKVHATDYTNASRTLLFDIHKKEWDTELCSLMDIPVSLLPAVKHTSGDFGIVTAVKALEGIPIRCAAGDQQAALFGQQCFKKGEAKNTYGTGAFVVMNTGDETVESTHGLITTLAADPEGNPCYALEGSIFIAGAAIQWLRDEIGILKSADESEQAALSVSDNGGVYLIPAFAGLGAPYWNMDVRGTITGLTRGANRNHIIRAALESMAYQTLDVVRIMEKETGQSLSRLAADGGASRNNFLMQFQADILGIDILRADQPDTTGLGAAYLAGLSSGFWNKDDLYAFSGKRRAFHPGTDTHFREKNIQGWHKALKQTLANSLQ